MYGSTTYEGVVEALSEIPTIEERKKFLRKFRQDFLYEIASMLELRGWHVHSSLDRKKKLLDLLARWPDECQRTLQPEKVKASA